MSVVPWVSREVGSPGDRIRITLADPFVIGSCKKIEAWEGKDYEADSAVAAVRASGGDRREFIAALRIPPGQEFVKLASELDRLGVSEKRARVTGNTTWVEATYDPLRVTNTSELLLVEHGWGSENDPTEELEDGPVEVASFDSLRKGSPRSRAYPTASDRQASGPPSRPRSTEDPPMSCRGALRIGGATLAAATSQGTADGRFQRAIKRRQVQAARSV